MLPSPGRGPCEYRWLKLSYIRIVHALKEKLSLITERIFPATCLLSPPIAASVEFGIVVGPMLSCGLPTRASPGFDTGYGGGLFHESRLLWNPHSFRLDSLRRRAATASDQSGDCYQKHRLHVVHSARLPIRFWSAPTSPPRFRFRPYRRQLLIDSVAMSHASRQAQVMAFASALLDIEVPLHNHLSCLIYLKDGPAQDNHV
jgi:hypothetical protein